MITVVIPMAGHGCRFQAAGYTAPKMAISAGDGATILEWSIKSLSSLFDHAYWVFICRAEHVEGHGVRNVIESHISQERYSLVPLDRSTAGQLCTVEMVSSMIDPNSQLLIHNCDTYFESKVDWETVLNDVDGVIPVFESTNPAYSYVDIDRHGLVTRVCEKQVLLSKLATVGTYAFRKASDFSYASKLVIADDERTNGEFYVSSVYRHLINLGMRFDAITVTESWPLGTPAELNRFNSEYLCKCL